MVPPTGEETGVPPLTQIFVVATVALSPVAPFHAGENLRGDNLCIERSMLGQLVRRARQNEEGLYVLFRFLIQEKERGPHLSASVKYHCQEQKQFVSRFSLLVCQEEENRKQEEENRKE